MLFYANLSTAGLPHQKCRKCPDLRLFFILTHCVEASAESAVLSRAHGILEMAVAKGPRRWFPHDLESSLDAQESNVGGRIDV
jgi:hypothetical protein